MGLLRDKIMDDAVSMDEWIRRDSPEQRKNAQATLRRAIAGAEVPLPPPYHKRRPGCLESTILTACLAQLRAHGVWCLRIDQSGKIVGGGESRTLIPGAHTGLGDILACHDGTLISLEVKAPGGRVSALQRRMLLDLQAAGAEVALVIDQDKLIPWLLDDEPATAVIDGIPVV